MSDLKHVVIGGICLPLDVESLEALPIDPGGAVQFTFIYADICFAARYEEGEQAGHLRMVGDVGPVPFSAESPQARAGLHQIVRAASDHLGPLLRISHGRILLACDVPVSRPVTAVTLISAVALHLVPAKPYLELISVYIRPPMEMGKVGASSVRAEWRRKRA